MQNVKCQPPKSPYHKHEFSVCREPGSFDPLFMENVNDIADTMSEIMIICGIHRCKANASRSLIIRAFQFYDIRKHTFEAADGIGSINRFTIVEDFENNCAMTRIEALLAYCIVKRAVKAFYHGTPDCSIRSPAMEAVILQQKEQVWLHAAQRTITIFERYEQMFYDSQINYASQIMKIYKELYARLQSRADPVVMEDYHPRGCVKRIVLGTKQPPKLKSEKQVCVEYCNKSSQLRQYIENLPPKKIPIKSCLTLRSPCNLNCVQEEDEGEDEWAIDNPPPPKKQKIEQNFDLNSPHCYQCNCPQVMCDCDIEPDSGVVAIECTQGPFQCQWVRKDVTVEDIDPCEEQPPEYHQCPVDCGSSVSSNESDSTGYCECSAESDKEDEEDENDTRYCYYALPLGKPQRKQRKIEGVSFQKDLCKLTKVPERCSAKISKIPLPKCSTNTQKYSLRNC